MAPDAPGALPLRQVRISDQIADRIVRYIAESGLSVGDPLPSENEWARMLGVSRPSVREATNTLAGRGLIQIATGKSPTVLSLSEQPFSVLVGHALTTGQITTLQVMEVRRGIEENAAALAARNRTDTDVAALERILAGLRRAVGDIEAFTKPDIAFHRAMARATGNLLLSSIMAGMAGVVLESSRVGLSYVRTPVEWDEILAVHEHVVAAVKDADPERARQAMQAHFDSAQRRFEREAEINREQETRRT